MIMKKTEDQISCQFSKGEINDKYHTQGFVTFGHIFSMTNVFFVKISYERILNFKYVLIDIDVPNI